MLDQVEQNTADRAAALEQGKYQPDHRLDLLVRIEGHLARGSADIAARQVQAKLAAQRLGALPRVQARFEQMQFGLTHRTFKAQQKSVVEIHRVVNAIGVGDERVE